MKTLTKEQLSKHLCTVRSPSKDNPLSVKTLTPHKDGSKKK
jgi:hypothetical protein